MDFWTTVVPLYWINYAGIWSTAGDLYLLNVLKAVFIKNWQHNQSVEAFQCVNKLDSTCEHLEADRTPRYNVTVALCTGWVQHVKKNSNSIPNFYVAE
jgi:hypothetical protein